MPLEADLKAHLQGDTAISALVADRIHPMLLHSNTLPAIVHQQVADEPQTDLSGGDGDMVRYRVQIVCWATSYVAVQALAELVRTRLQTAASSFKALPLPSGQDVYEDKTKRFGFYRDFAFWYRTT